MASLDRANVQSLILAPYQRPISRHLLLKFGSKIGGRRFVAELEPSVARGDRDPNDRSDLINVALSWDGLKTIGAFDTMGGDAAAARAFYLLNDAPDGESLRVAGASAPTQWWNQRFSSGDIHLVVHIHVWTEEALQAATTRIRDAARRFDLSELFPTADDTAITGRLIDGRRLHFGYEDGISHPAVNWDDEPQRGDLLPRADFLLGYAGGHYSTYPDAPPFSDFVRDGSMAAFMVIRQDVAAFNRFLRDNAPKVAPELSQADAEDYLAAKMMGRWRDGTPMALSPDRPDPAKAMADEFGYADDPKGLKCPLSAHIRVANARDQPLTPLNRDLFPGGFPRLLRRGSPYGPPLDGIEDDGVDRGIVGMFLCANLNKQFYTITRWLGRTDFSPLFADQVGQDPIVGNAQFPGASSTFAIADSMGRPTALKRISDFVGVQGVALLLLPSLSTIRALASDAT